MFYWFPKVKNCGVPMPETIMVRWEGEFSWNPIDGEPHPPFDNMVEGAKEAAMAIGYPVFVRSDMTSAKHDWKDSCYVERPEQMRDHIAKILEFSALADIMGIAFNGVAVREFLELDWRFKAFWGEMPVAKEFRFFVRDGKVECWHPYWPPMSIIRPSIENWREVLKEISCMDDEEYPLLVKHVEAIGRAVGGYWSVDLCKTMELNKTKQATWYMTDMAVGEESYHWGTCPNAPPVMLLRYGDPEKVEVKHFRLSEILSLPEIRKEEEK